MLWHIDLKFVHVGSVQLEALKATTETKEVTFKIAYGLPIEECLRYNPSCQLPTCLGISKISQASCIGHCFPTGIQ